METLISILSTIITIFFLYNLSELLKKIKDGKIINKNSLLATSALIFHFFSLALYFSFNMATIVLISQFYLLGCLIYLLKKK